MTVLDEIQNTETVIAELTWSVVEEIKLLDYNQQISCDCNSADTTATHMRGSTINRTVYFVFRILCDSYNYTIKSLTVKNNLVFVVSIF